MGYRDPKSGALRGFTPGVTRVKCKNGTSGTVAQYSVVQLDFLDTSTNVDSIIEGDPDSVFGTFTQSETAMLTHGLYGVAQESIASGDEGYVLFEGQSTVLFTASATAAQGSRAVPTNASLRATVGSGSKVVFVTLEDKTTTAATSVLCEVQGINSFR